MYVKLEVGLALSDDGLVGRNFGCRNRAIQTLSFKVSRSGLFYNCRGLIKFPRRKLVSVLPSGGGVFSPEKGLEEASSSLVSKDRDRYISEDIHEPYFRIHR
jgi:hypothetical protein